MEYRLEESLQVLRQTPATLRSMLGGLDELWVRNNYGDKTFSPFDVVGHLISGETKDWMERLKIILAHGEGRPFDPFDRFDMWERDKGRSMSSLLDEFERLRSANLRELEAMDLERDQFTLTGTHPELGRVTLEQLLATWTVHDLSHIAQISRCMAHQYRRNVGPWKAYMSILNT